MARRVHISLTELKEYAGSIYCFRSNLERDCADLQQAFRKVSATVDDETREAFGGCIGNIERTLDSSQKEMDELLIRILKYAVMLKRLENEADTRRKELTSEQIKEFLTDFVMGIIMHAYITSAEREYMSVEGYRMEKKKSAVMIVNKVMAAVVSK